MSDKWDELADALTSDWWDLLKKRNELDASLGDLDQRYWEMLDKSIAKKMREVAEQARLEGMAQTAEIAEDLDSPDTCPMCPRDIGRHIRVAIVLKSNTAQLSAPGYLGNVNGLGSDPDTTD